jgi:hypothetical protein
VPSGIVNLKPLYDFVRDNRASAKDAMRVDRTSELGNKYRKIVRDSVSGVAEAQGVYLWGFYNRNGFWTNIYLGQAALKKTASLQNRLFKELTAERASIWREVLSFENLKEICKCIHPHNWRKNIRHWERACEKSGSTHIVWIALPELDSKSVAPIENDLIEAMNPTGNRKRTQPPERFREDTKRIFGQFRGTINVKANRDTSFALEQHKDFWRQVS